MDGIITLFVDNLADRVNPFALRKFFTDYGVVRDVFIPNKRGKNSGRKFGFVRFDCTVSANIAIEKANGSRFLDNTIFVKRAAFNKKGREYSNKVSDCAVTYKESQKQHIPLSRRGFEHEQNLKDGDSCFYKSESVKRAIPSFANVVSGKKSVEVNRYSVVAREEDIEWLDRSIVARLHAHRDVGSISEAFLADGVFNIHIRAMGGNMVVLTFPSSHERNCMLDGGELSWLSNWFVDAKPWNPNNKVECSRLVWLNCYGIPLNLWNADTFFRIGKLWGETITLDEATSKKIDFSVGKIKISTKAFEVINHCINLEHNGMVYPIRVVEEQVVVNNFMKAICECKGCSFARVDYSLYPREKLSGTSVKSVDEELDGDETSLENPNDQISSGSVNFIMDESPNDAGDGLGLDIGESKEEIDSFEDIAAERQMENSMEEVEEVADTEDGDYRKSGDSAPLSDANQIPNQATNKGIKGKRSRKCIDEILGFTRCNTRETKGRNKKKSVVLRAAVASAALSASISSGDINNRNMILLDEAQAIWAVDKLYGLSYDGDENEVISKIAEMEALNRARSDN